MTSAARPLPRGYEVVGLLGAGACGEVLLARQEALGRLVAVKRIHSFALDRPEELDRFRREAAVLAAVDHPGVVRLYDFTRHEGDPLIVMEYVDGVTLASLLTRGPMPAPAAVRVLSDVAAGLTAVARRGIAHRDVKPANVFVLADGSAKLGDFGLARVTADPSVFRTADGSMSGTPAYLAPEVILGDEPDERADAYSFAVLSYETLTGRRPFEGSVAEMLAAHSTAAVQEPSSFLADFPAAASDALLEGLHKDPERRLPPAELVARLAAVPEAEWPRATERAPASETRTLSAMPTTVQLARRGLRRRRVRLAAAAAAVAVGAVAAGAVATRDDRLSVTAVDVAADAAEGRCPGAVFRFTATLTTEGGGGEVLLRWTRPDGQALEPVRVDVASDASRTTAVLEYRLTGGRPLSGAASVTVLQPTRLQASSPVVRYVC